MDENRGYRIARAALYLPTLASLTVASIAVHASISTAVAVYNILWRRKHRMLLN